MRKQEGMSDARMRKNEKREKEGLRDVRRSENQTLARTDVDLTSL